MSIAILGIDTSSTWCSAALVRGPDVFARRAEVGNAHSDHLLTMVDAVLKEAALALPDCNAIAFAAGPGSFTGLRVACAAAQGLAFGASLRVASIGTLDAIAHSVASAEDLQSGSMLVAQDARMGEVYWSLLRMVDGRLRIVVEPSLASPASLRVVLHEEIDAGSIDIGCGNAWQVHGAAMNGLVDRVFHRETSDALDVARLGALALIEGRLIDADQASPIYVRNDVARTTLEREARARALDPA
jgi:tRNA threonylcarbamoyladenosine biosynthesis protein TsaB